MGFVRQVVANVDQEHLYGAIPCVCLELRELALSLSRSIDVELSSWDSAERFGEWLERRGTRLTSLAVDVDKGIWLPIDEDNYQYFDYDPPLAPDEFTAPEEHKYLLDTIGELTQLRSLHLTRFHIHNETAQLPRLINLTSLRLDSCAMSIDAQQTLTALTNLQHLELRKPSDWNFGFMGCEPLMASLKQLSYLDLSEQELGKEDLAALRQLVHLRDLKLRRCTYLDVACLEDIQHLPCSELYLSLGQERSVASIISWLERSQTQQQLLHLDLSHHGGPVPASLTAGLLSPLAQVLNLQHLGFLGFSVEGLSQKLGNLTQLTSLVIEFCPNAGVTKNELQSTMPWLETLVVLRDYIPY